MTGLTWVLIPGAGGSAWYWHLLEPKLRERGNHVISVSLPAGDDTAGLPEYADAVIRALGNHDRENLGLVAQSMAGFTAPLVCNRVPVALLVLLNAMIPSQVKHPASGGPIPGTARLSVRATCAMAVQRTRTSILSSTSSMTCLSKLLMKRWRKDHLVNPRQSSQHRVGSIAGRTCPRGCWWGGTTGSFPRSSSGVLPGSAWL
jgi:pimeloyl-ACP methyl ester carboxylesterase